MPNTDENVVTDALNQLLGAYWTGYAPHQTHVALLASWGLHGLAADMGTHIADEPLTIGKLLDRLLEINGRPAFTSTAPNIGADLRSVLENDMAIQRNTRPALNAIAESAGAAHDATTRTLVETILVDEELHLAWLETELELFEKLGEALYTANRLQRRTAP
jgi:bacterioferritin